MKHNRPRVKAVEAIISVAKVQGMAKRNNIGLVDKTAELYARNITTGVAVRKPYLVSDKVTVRFLNRGNSTEHMIATMRAELNAIGFDLSEPTDALSVYTIVKIGA